jgi:hypothetical protein
MLVAAILIVLPLSLSGGMAAAEEAEAGTDVTVAASDAAPSEEPEVDAPVQEPADEPLPPTDVPTEAPTDVPTEIPTEIPTDVPTAESTAAPTEEPTVTELATDATATAGDPAPTETETETPSPTATAEPPVPFAPVIECVRPEWGGETVAGESEWGVLTCALHWDTERVQDVRAVARPRDDGWSVVLVTEVTIEQGLPLGDEDHRLDLADSVDDDDGFLTARFVLGTRIDCLAPLATVVSLEFTAVSNPAGDDEGALEETVTLPVQMAARQPSAPALTGMSVSFAPITNSLTGNRVSPGVVTLSFDGAPERCGWAVTISFDDFTAGENVIPAEQLVAVSAGGVDGLDISSGGGVIWVVMPRSEAPRDASGIITIETELDLGSFKPQGSYGSTVTVDVSLVQ